ncbi:phospholipase B1, membrane-associated [Lucilia cuprina]|uniref:phospholipase B1, membrane-associated n=1 Tax=Lucilia cuprina TaxID=7375 RepID=UPI001F0588F5|nr:phospholipase B1, membrane-associated [Lucilia cuprina]
MLTARLFVLVALTSTAIAQETKATKYFLEKTNIQIKPFSLQNARNGKLHTSNLEQFRDLYANTKYLLTQQYYRDYKTNYKYIVDEGKVQPKIGTDVPFPCGTNNSRSLEPPTSVHRLRPGDIDIIGALGDSITAGTAMMSKTLLQLFIEFRGQTVLGGGLKDWRTFLTLPNILKVFNPNLYGYSVANTLGKFREARFNPAEPFAITQDMPHMAEVLVKRMQTDPKVDMLRHWKMISIFIGANDICNDMCSYDKIEDFFENHRRDLHRTLTILKENIPRLIVNVISIPDIDTTIRLMKGIPAQCVTLHKASCRCVISDSLNSKQLKEIRHNIKRFQEIDAEVTSLPEFQLEDFAAVPRALAVNKTLRTLKDGRTDLRFFAIDCFHFSQYGNAAFTNMLWNDMLQVKSEPYSTLLRPFEIFNCPSEELPYISTLANT